MNPGITPSGLFWTTPIPADAVEVHPGRGRARLRVQDLHVTDFGNIPNALFGGGPEPVPAVVSYEIRWTGESHPVQIVNPADGFAAEFVRGSAQMEWSARVGDFEFVSAPLETSSSIFAEVGHERNGMFAA